MDIALHNGPTTIIHANNHFQDLNNPDVAITEPYIYVICDAAKYNAIEAHLGYDYNGQHVPLISLDAVFNVNTSRNEIQEAVDRIQGEPTTIDFSGIENLDVKKPELFTRANRPIPTPYERMGIEEFHEALARYAEKFRHLNCEGWVFASEEDEDEAFDELVQMRRNIKERGFQVQEFGRSTEMYALL